MIVGIDEVGRGAWAGPLVVGAVLLGGQDIDGLTDSKKLTREQREYLDREIRMKAAAIGIGWVNSRHVDKMGLTKALKLASRRALGQIRSEYSEIIIDGNVAFIDDERVTVMKKADLLVPSVSAASIVAKVARDNYMRHVGRIFPGYRFASHVGYGTAFHRKAIEEKGVTPLHRLSYTPLQGYSRKRKFADFNKSHLAKRPVSLTTRQLGDRAEEAAARHLEFYGHEIMARNWRTKYCEIDIVSRRDGVVYFTEVKYRASDTRGDGLAAITPKKLQQMTFAAEIFTARFGLESHSLRLSAAAMTGVPPVLTDLIELN